MYEGGSGGGTGGGEGGIGDSGAVLGAGGSSEEGRITRNVRFAAEVATGGAVTGAGLTDKCLTGGSLALRALEGALTDLENGGEFDGIGVL